MKEIKIEPEETPKDELNEPLEMQAKEAKGGTEEHDTKTGKKLTIEKSKVEEDTADIPEQFQKDVSALLIKCKGNKACADYVRSKLMSIEMDAMKKSKPVEFTEEDMPD